MQEDSNLDDSILDDYELIDPINSDVEFTSGGEEEIQVEMGVYITDDGTEEMTLEELEVFNKAFENSLDNSDNYLTESFLEIRKEVSKSLGQSTQSQAEIGERGTTNIGETLSSRVINPPYPPQCLIDLIDGDSTASKSIDIKVKDSTSRKITIKPIGTIKPEGGEEDSEARGFYDHGDFITQEEFDKDCRKIQDFLKLQSDCEDDFEETSYKAFSDREAVGWGAFEVIRAASGVVAQVNHMPGVNLRRLRGMEGFVEITGYDMSNNAQYTFYQNFGDKVVVDEPDIFDPATFDPNIAVSDKPTRATPYDPHKHGELQVGRETESGSRIRWELKDKNGNDTESFKDACNEVLFLPKSHRGSRYYGISPHLSVIAPMLANSFIDSHVIQYFEHNCVPRYAVSITGANVDKKLIDKITKFLSTEVKGNQHKTLVFAPKSGFGGKVEVKFIKLDADRKEQDYIDSYKFNSQRIMTVNGMSPALLGISENASIGSGRGASQAENYKNRESLPAQLYAARRINKLLRLGLGCKYARIEYDPLDFKDAEALARIIQILLVQGVISINEARNELGKGPKKGGDTQFVRIKEKSMIKIEDLPNMTSELIKRLEDSDIELEDTTDEMGPQSSDLPSSE